MRLRLDGIRKKGMVAAVVLSVAMLWAGGGVPASAAENEDQGEPVIVGHQKQLYRDSGDVIALSGGNILDVNYSSGNKDVAVVNSAGVVSGVEEGTTEITAEVQYDKNGETKTKKLSYELKVIDNFTNYFDILNGDIKNITEKGKTLKEMYIPDYCNGIRVVSADWKKILSKNSVVEKIFLSDYIESFCDYGFDNRADAPGNLREVYFGKSVSYYDHRNSSSSLEKFEVHPGNQVYYTKDGVLYGQIYGQLTLVSYPVAKKDISYTVPESVESIGSYAFSGAKNLASVSLPKGLKSIEYYAFAGAGLTEISIPAGAIVRNQVFADCEKLQKVLLPNDASNADVIFQNCPVLKTVVVPNSVQYVSARFFENCPNLTEFQISSGSSDFQVEDGVLYKRSTKVLVAYPMGKKTSKYTVPKGIKTIGYGGFYGAKYLQEVKLDDALTEIQYDAFTSCVALKKIRIPKKVRTIQGSFLGKALGVFWGCTSLKEITVASQNKYFSSSKGVLYNKSGKKLYRYPSSKKGSKFTVPKKVTQIEEFAFGQNRYLQKVVVGNHVKSIGRQGFKDGKALKTVVLSSKMTHLSSRIFENCKKLTKVTLPDKIDWVQRRVFAHCTGLKEVVLGKKVNELDSQVFYDCVNLRKVTFKGKKWLKMPTNDDTYSEDNASRSPFYLAGSKKYSRLTVHIPKCTKTQQKKAKKILKVNGLHKKAKVKFATK